MLSLTSHPVLPTIVALTQSLVATTMVAKPVKSTAIAIIVGPVFSEGFDISFVVEDILSHLATLGSVHAVIQEVSVGSFGVMLRYKVESGDFVGPLPYLGNMLARTEICIL